MKIGKIIDLEEVLRKREAPLIKKYLQKKEFAKINRIADRQIWRKERHAQA